MKSIYIAFAVCLIAIDGSAQETGGDKPASDRTEKFQYDGVWKPKGAQLGGVLLPPPTLEGITLTIEKGSYEVTVVGEDHSDVGSFILDENSSPKRMTIKSIAGPNAGKTIYAIYEIKNKNAMRVCYDLSGTDFPQEFKAPKDTEFYLVGYRRQIVDEPTNRADTIGNRDASTEDQLLAFTKRFCVAMREKHNEDHSSELREYIDPRYLKEHGLLEGEFKLEMAPVGSIHNIQLADDNCTLLCHVETGNGQTEAILLRTVLRDKRIFILPLQPPNQETKEFSAWILRMKL